MPPRKRLGQLLMELKVIDEHQLQSALGHQKQWGGKLGVILVQKGFCREDQMIATLSQHLGMPAVRLAEAKIDPRAVKTVSKSVAERLHVFAYEVTGSGRSEVITIAMSDPTDLSAVDQLAFHTGKRIKPMLAGDSEVIAAIQQYYGGESAEEGQSSLPPGSRPFVEGARAGGRATPVAPLSAVPPGATPTPGFSRRVEPPRPPPPVMQAAPYAHPPERSAAAEVAIPGEDLPADAPMDGLEPIAAHVQGEESVQGAEDVAGQGASADAVADLEAANAGEAVFAVDVQTMEELEPGAGAQESAGAPAQAADELPVEAIMGTADVLGTAPEGAGSDAPDAWNEIADPLAAAAGEAAAESESGEASESAWVAAAAEVAAAAADLAAATEEERLEAPAESGAAFRATSGESDSLLEPPGDSPSPAEEVAIEAEGWSEDAQTATEEAQGEAGAEQEAPFAMEGDSEEVRSHTQRHGWLSRRAAEGTGTEQEQAEVAYAEEPAPEGGYPEHQDAVSGEIEGSEQQQQEEYAGQEYAEGDQPADAEGWVASPEDQAQSAVWFGDALSSTMPLSPADLGTLAALGLDPFDAAAAQRALACLVRVLNRRQAIDLDELAAEIQESRIAGEAAAQGQADEQPAGAELQAGAAGETAE
jgi:type II secretion system (T2SS) protein E